MRYIRIQRIVKKVCDDNISDMTVVKGILQQVKDKRLVCSMVLNQNYAMSYHQEMYILDLMDDKFAFKSIKNKASIKDSAEYSQIQELKVETEIEKMVDLEDKDNRFYMLDLE